MRGYPRCIKLLDKAYVPARWVLQFDGPDSEQVRLIYEWRGQRVFQARGDTAMEVWEALTNVM